MNGDQDGPKQQVGAVASYQPAALLADVMVMLLQRGIQGTLRGRDLPQAHQAAWTLLDLLGVPPDTSHCPCLACGGADFCLVNISLVAGDGDGNKQ